MATGHINDFVFFIAVSSLYVGVENIVRRNMENRWLLAFGFGLVHGLRFRLSPA